MKRRADVVGTLAHETSIMHLIGGVLFEQNNERQTSNHYNTVRPHGALCYRPPTPESMRKITLGLARFARGEHVPVELGNLNARRDWGFAGDYVEGMWRMLQQDGADDYVLATGVTTPIRDFVNFTAETLGLDLDWSGSEDSEQAVDRKTGKVAVKVNPKFYRPAEVELLLGDATKAKTKLGWQPKVGIRELAVMMAKSDYDDWHR